ncbi:hypothetical protein KPL76_04220 [Subtercola sp. PAMC28395]|uniref:hypothetical protein n=1 Tax=Subtercola sp. PAMC28395 TaxID=2846775 RepID=UPI001C0E0615|nr:hypothetical protein [Subtercola sp. PAMC28395]QWT24598.1 hypothetical protein KPL76_04220 [Subtercola sp. PAMC28395]
MTSMTETEPRMVSTASTRSIDDVAQGSGKPVDQTPDAAPGAGADARFTRLYSRLRRRELHSPRSTAAIATAVVVSAVFAYLVVEIVLRLFGQPALLASPSALAAGMADAATYPSGLLLAGGLVIVLVGLALLVIAVSPGRRARHALTSPRAVVVADNEVIASSIARHAARAARTSPDNVMVSVSSRTALVHIVPASGVLVDTGTVGRAVEEHVGSLGLGTGIRCRVTVAEHGKVGA